jgi:DNA-binding transcriptional regulator of glucitol operon
MQYLPLTVLLIGALLASMTLSHLQHRYYLRTVRGLMAEHRSPDLAVVSGICRGRLRGAIAVLVVHRERALVERALFMEGGSVLARFREDRTMRGQTLPSILERDLPGARRGALEDAHRRFRRMVGDEDASLESILAEARERRRGQGPISGRVGRLLDRAPTAAPAAPSVAAAGGRRHGG